MKRFLIPFALFSLILTACKSDDNDSEPAVEICGNGIDDDNDGFTDCQDNDCSMATTIECDCSDGLDNDNDAFLDEEDADCQG